MLPFFSAIGGFFSKAFSKEMLPVTLVVLLGGSIFLNFNTCSRLSWEKEQRAQDKMIYNQNFEAFLDTIRVSYNEKLNAFEYDKKAFMTTLDELAKYDSALSRKLDGVKGDIINAIDAKIGIDGGKVEVDNELETYDNNNYGLKWNYNYADAGFTQFLGGVSKFRLDGNKIFAGKTLIDSNYMTLGVTYGFRELDDRYKVWAISASPKVRINELSGAYFIDKPPPYAAKTMWQNRWTFGPYIGYGVNFDSKFQDARLGWNFGVSLQYHLFGFGKKPIRQKKSDKGSESFIPTSTDELMDKLQ